MLKSVLVPFSYIMIFSKVDPVISKSVYLTLSVNLNLIRGRADPTLPSVVAEVRLTPQVVVRYGLFMPF